MTNFKQVFGEDKLTWFFPTTPRVRVNALELLYVPDAAETGKIYCNE